MKTIRTTEDGIDYLIKILKDKLNTITRAIFWKIPHGDSEGENISLKIGRYKKDGFAPETLEVENPRSELTLENEAFQNSLG